MNGSNNSMDEYVHDELMSGAELEMVSKLNHTVI